MGMSREACWAERWKWKEHQRRLLFRGWLQTCVLELLALATIAHSSDLPGGCIGLAAGCTGPAPAGNFSRHRLAAVGGGEFQPQVVWVPSAVPAVSAQCWGLVWIRTSSSAWASAYS